MSFKIQSSDETREAILLPWTVFILWLINIIIGWSIFFLSEIAGWYVYLFFIAGHIFVATFLMRKRFGDLQKFKASWCDTITIIGVPYLGAIIWMLKSKN